MTSILEFSEFPPAAGTPETDDERQTAQLTLAAHYAETFATESGQIVLADMMTRFHFLTAVHIPAVQGAVGGGPYETAFRDGERNAVLFILQQRREAERAEPEPTEQEPYHPQV